jgi:D-glycero-D-manno-heptose 1,7-bisphosphate phosphatase
MKCRGATFLDRDGTVTAALPRGTYVRAPEQLRLAEGAGQAVARLNAAGWPVVLITNQRWLSSPAARMADYLRVHAQLEMLLTEQGARLDAHYVCPHPRFSCGCRKPAAGMLFMASRDYGYQLGKSVLIGDSEADIAAGRAAGVSTVRIDPAAAARGDALAVSTLAEAVDRWTEVAGGRR